MRDNAAYNDLNILIEWSVDIDNKLYKQVMKKKHDDSNTDRSEIYMRGISKKNKESYYRTSNLYKCESIKLDITEKKKSQFERSKFKRKKISMTCYVCDKSNYIARNCQSDNKVH